jgi:hypothetical protein
MESVFSDNEKVRYRHVTHTPASARPYDLTMSPAQRFILAEMIKLSQLDVAVLVDFVKAHGIEPEWMQQQWFHMQLPRGRPAPECPVEIPSRVRVPNLPSQAAP